MPQRAKQRAKQHDLIVWQELPDGSQRGVLSERVSQPYLADVDARGRWELYAYDEHDQRQNVASGKANKVTKAKAHTVAAALVHIPELQDTTQDARNATQGGAVIDAKVTRLEQPAWLITVKVYIALALFVFAALLFARWALFNRPVWFFRVGAWLFVSLFGAWQLLKAGEHLDKRRERLAKRKVIDLQAALSKKGGK